ncbi:MAG: VWA domain-containing protein [Syntrophomonadaceae bacterium]|nr:VWA domain-containing protein [Syntrophomonadaceae bacterium]MDD3888380.1 VWA domain-containing protein [Syntrophomonadaceae bacterium]MDD4548885.1 VWA domain-containing protein [Syntrophomonadaceae bacterium]
MGISFNYPWLLILLPLVIAPVYLWQKDALMEKPRRLLITSLRVTLLTMLILALAGIQIHYKIQGQSVVFVVDASASCEEGINSVEKFIQQAVKDKKAADKVGIVVCGDNARIEQSLVDDFRAYDIESIIDRNYSNLQEGLKLADALMPDPSNKRLVLISDGQQNKGDAGKEVEYLRDKNVRIDVLPLNLTQGPDIRIDEMQIPRKLFAGEKFPIKIKITGNTSALTNLRVFKDGRMIIEEKVKVNRGENTFIYNYQIDDGGMYAFTSKIEAQDDTIPENNEASVFTSVHGKPVVLLVESQPGEGRAIASAINSLGIDAVTVTPETIPAGLEYLQHYQVIILCNVPAESLNEGAMEAIETGVRDFGIGLIMVGGEQSFGPGGYYKTPVEKALPVYMDLRAKEQIPSLALALVIDKSGSMSDTVGGFSKIDLAREAAIQATEILSPQDKIGVIAFDSAARWVVEMKPADNAEEIRSDIGTIRAGGGTNIFPALQLAYNSLKNAEAKYKHIILLTDGQSATSGDYYYLSRRMNREEITMSTLAVGKGADIALMEQLAEWGGGRYYFSDDAYNIPRIFTKETMKALRHYLIEEEFIPALTARTPLMSGITQIPVLQGYVATSPKKTASVEMVSHIGDPILARWQYGLGRSIALTTDAGGRWAGQWVNWSYYNQLWGNLISWVLPRDENTNLLTIKSSIHGSQGLIEVDSNKLTDYLPTTATVVNPELGTEKVELELVAPGKYQGYFALKDPGVYWMSVIQQDGDELRRATGGISMSYSPEYNTPGVDMKFLEQLATSGGGSIISEPKEAFADNLSPATGSIPLSPWLLIVAILLLPLDIAARRLNWTRSDIKDFWARFQNKKREEPENDHSLSRLQIRKNLVQQGWDEKQQIQNKTSSEREISQVTNEVIANKEVISEKPNPAPNKSDTAKEGGGKETDSLSRLLAAKKRAKK